MIPIKHCLSKKISNLRICAIQRSFSWSRTQSEFIPLRQPPKFLGSNVGSQCVQQQPLVQQHVPSYGLEVPGHPAAGGSGANSFIGTLEIEHL